MYSYNCTKWKQFKKEKSAKNYGVVLHELLYVLVPTAHLVPGQSEATLQSEQRLVRLIPVKTFDEFKALLKSCW
ncbi:hypothetical protein L596_013850 [Steinernema carpocapsae]|uniref:Uncharacterized protein n=1 Tax=Steinernema carpocapsae TaxID=34508 RepID=A0A4U5P2Q5_STECR|nr:hypothetical protein L596_013850 [Steinernema carpocapsae]